MGTRVVLDTNVLISALGWGGKPEQCLELVFEDRVEAYSSPAILDELTRVLDYDRFEFSEDEKRRFLEIVAVEFRIVEPDVEVNSVDADPDDDKFLECAIAANADYVVSGDSHLLDVGEYDGIPVKSPEAFIDAFQE